jgi:signal recognition particle receptor subunit beta
MVPKKEILRLKIAVIGSANSGKTTFIRKIIDEQNFSLLPYEPTTEY